MAEKPRLELKPMPDGFGFLYGQLHVGDDSYRVDIMPPEPEWRGDIKMQERLPHPTDWVVYVNGDEIARVRKREDIDTVAMRAIADRSKR